MKIHLALLLTYDPDFEKALADALGQIGAKVLAAHDVNHALEIGCRRATELDVAVIDRSDCHAITLLSALRACRHDLPVIVVTSGEACHCAALAYANGATACLAKPITPTELSLAIHELSEPKLQLTAA